MNTYIVLVAKGLKLDQTVLRVDREPLEVHVAADVEVHSLAESDQAGVVHLDGLGGVLKFWRPGAR